MIRTLRLLLLPLLLPTLSAWAEVRICGVQEDDLVLKPENNPYILVGDVLIKSRTLWTVNPGVVIKVASAPLCTAAVPGIDEPHKGALITLCVKGAFNCVGGADKRIRIEPLEPAAGRVSWYGIIFDNIKGDYAKLYYTDVSGALCGLKIKGGEPLVRNCVFQGNQTAIQTVQLCKSKIHNNAIVRNFSTGLLNDNATPFIFSNLFAWNLIGVWSDARSKVEIEYNDFFSNPDGHFNNCPPKYGMITEKNKRGDSCDFMRNLFVDPVLFGSASHADSLDKDLRVSTDTSKADVVNKKLSRFIVETIPDSVKKRNELAKPHRPWQLSPYSRLINAGKPGSEYLDADGTINDIGLHGCAEFKFK